MIPQERKYFIIIVHYGQEQPTKSLINSLIKQINNRSTIIVVDHAKSPLGNSWEENVIVVRPHTNNGYAGGLTTGLGVALSKGALGGDVMVCMNNDLSVGQDFIKNMQTWVEHHPKATIAGPVVGYLNLLTGRARLSSASEKVGIFEQKFIHGACMVITLQAVLDSGAFPEEYFMYWEDVLIANHIKRRGGVIRRIPLKSFKHEEREPSNASLYYLVRNGVVYLETETPLFWPAYWMVANRVRYIWHAHVSKKLHIAKAIRDGITR